MEIYFKNPTREHRILGFGCYKDHKWTILSLGSYPTAYVENKMDIKEYDDPKLDQIETRAYFNYCDTANWETDDDDTQYFGWDYGHIDDYALYPDFCWKGREWTYEEILAEVYSVIDQLVELEKNIKEGENDN